MNESPRGNMSDTKRPVKDYYELLQVSPDAGPMDIIHAYRHAKLAYQPDSLAVYSLYSDEEIEHIRAQIEEAYHVLSDPEKRRAYDAARGMEAGPEQTGRQQKVIRFSDYSRQDDLQDELDMTPDKEIEQSYDDVEAYTGALLREIREKKGITIDAIAKRTRISKQYLHAIEAEKKEDFPATVYLKGYLGQYAAEIGLDPQKVVHAYPPLAETSGT